MLRYGFLLIVFLHSVAFGQVLPSTSSPQPLTASTNSPASTSSTDTYSITITVKNIRNKNGVIRFKFYDDSTPFPHDFGFLKEVVPKTEVTGDSLRVTFYGFKSQHMAIALLDDENDNVKLDFGWFLPKEGHAFSDYYHSALRRPVYADFAFTLTGDRNVVMIMRYY